MQRRSKEVSTLSHSLLMDMKKEMMGLKIRTPPCEAVLLRRVLIGLEIVTTKRLQAGHQWMRDCLTPRSTHLPR